MISESRMPTHDDLLWPTLKALESIGGSASIQELSSRVAMDMSLPDGAPAIDLIDGSEPCALLKKLELGVKTTTVQEITLEPKFFEAL